MKYAKKEKRSEEKHNNKIIETKVFFSFLRWTKRFGWCEIFCLNGVYVLFYFFLLFRLRLRVPRTRVNVHILIRLPFLKFAIFNLRFHFFAHFAVVIIIPFQLLSHEIDE